MNVWEDRLESLRALGYSSYEEYLASKLWKRIRSRRFRFKGARECRYCGKASEQLHHASYSIRTLAGKHLNALVPICKFCHEFGSVKKGRVLSPKAATRRLIARAKRLGVDPRRTFRREPMRRRRKPNKANQAKQRAVAEGQAILDTIDERSARAKLKAGQSRR